MNSETNGLEIAIIGMSGRFPGSKDIDGFWKNLLDGVELVSSFSDRVSDKSKQSKQKVKVGAVLQDVELFDASFFGFNPREAEIMDPQHRMFLECAWEALENAGYDSERENRAIGIYAGVGMGYYLYYNLYPHRDLLQSIGGLQSLIGVDKDYVPSRVSYKLNLKGPSVSVGTACSSSLVAVHLACQSLLGGECYMALAAGVAVKVPQNELTLSPDEIISPDGHCRAFDAKANGTLGGNGIGVVVLKRLEDAIADRDYIYAVIKGSAINNDGSSKIGYTAPSEDGQARVIHAAQVMAEVEPKTITYMEAHGTGTPLGDPIEVAAMTRAFRLSTDRKGYCAIGSVKTNVGHLDAAAGITSLIKTTLALHHKLLPPSINFEQPNPQINFEHSPFYVNNKLREWQANGSPRRAGVSSFGIGGTNAHAILEEAPVECNQEERGRKYQLLVLSAKTSSALEAATTNLVRHLKQHPQLNLPDVAYTLQVGRREFHHRRMTVVENLEEAIATLESATPQRVMTQIQEDDRSVVFMFSGQGAQYANMARELYGSEATFRAECDRCFELLQPHLQINLAEVLFPSAAAAHNAAQQLQQTAIAQPALFVIEYALAKLWMSWGVRPVAVIGHSIGEYVAACIAGVFSLEDALAVVATRGRLMQQMPPGKMLSVGLSTEEVQSFLNENLSLAASNAPKLSVISGCEPAIEQLERELQARGIDSRHLHTSHAFHSAMMEAIVEPFTEYLKTIDLKPPQLAFISNVTGTWITTAEATDQNYWARHLRQRVRFSEGIAELLQDAKRVFLEVGPGRTLSTLAKQQAPGRVVLSSLRHPKEEQSDVAFVLHALGRLWLTGVQVDWSRFSASEQRRRLPLPTYPFERQRYWIDPPAALPAAQMPPTPLEKENYISQVTAQDKRNIADWFYVPKWKPTNISLNKSSDASVLGCTLVFADRCGLSVQLLKQLKQQGQNAIAVQLGSEFAQIDEFTYSLNPQNGDDYNVLLSKLRAQNQLPATIVHLWNVTSQSYAGSGLAGVEQAQYLGFYSLLFLAQAIGKQNVTQKLQIAVVSSNMQPVTQAEIHPEKATLLGAVKVIPLEYPNITCRSIDLSVGQNEQLVNQLLTELTAPTFEQISAYRDDRRWVQVLEPVRLEETAAKTPRLRERGVYLITGGLGGVGLVLAEYLAKTVRAKLLLIGRSAFPARADWQTWLATHDESDRTSYQIRKVQELEALGAQAIVANADVANLEQVQQAIAQAKQQFGQLNGIIHAAGVAGGGAIGRKTFEAAERVFAPKVKGTVVLDTLLKDTQLDFFVLCSSLASAQGGFGQVDYCAANAFLDAFAHYKTTTDGTFTVGINWDVWQEVGMAATAKRSPANSVTKTQFLAVNHPLFDSCIIENSQEIYISKLSVSKHWILKEHRLMGKAMVPGTAFLEMALAAWANHTHQQDTRATQMREVYFPTPLIVEDNVEKEVRTILKQKGDLFEFKIVSCLNSESEQWLEHAIGEITSLDVDSSQKLAIAELESKCNEGKNVIQNNYHPLKGFAEFGSRWNNLKQVNLGQNRGLALLELSQEFTDDIGSYKLHPALFDLAVHFLVDEFRGESYYLPFSYKKLTIKSPLPAKIYSHSRLMDRSPSGNLKFNLTILDDLGTELIEIEDYTLRQFHDTKQHSLSLSK